MTEATRAFTRRLSVPLLALQFLLLSACTKEQSCEQTLNQLVCTESSRWPTWLIDNWYKTLAVLVFLAFGWITNRGSAKGAKEPVNTRPESISVPNLKVGDRVQDSSGGVLVVRSVGWMSADELEVTWSDGGSQRFTSNTTIMRLPPIEG